MILHGSNEVEMSQLLRKPCVLNNVMVVTIIDSEEPHAQFMMGALFTRIRAEATAHEVVRM